jgi:hypothetical protein
MSHFAKVLNGKVLKVIVAEQEFFDTYVDDSAGNWIQTSYNTRGNIHYDNNGNPDGKPALRGNYAGIGYTYDSVNDVFYAEQPYPSWILDTNTWIWNAPVPLPDNEKSYRWDETITSWVESV